MLLSAKIGTLSLTVVRVCRKRTAPKVGEVFEIYEDLLPGTMMPRSGTKPHRVRCTEIRDTGEQKIWFCERW
jgi:hypothetical protein